MSRSLSSAFVTEITAGHLLPIVLCKFSFASGDLNLWAGVGTIQWNGDVYTGIGALAGISQVVETGEIKATNVQFSMSGVDQTIIALALAESYQNRPAKMWVAVLDTDFNVIADPYLLFSGKMDVMTINDQPVNSNITLTCENDLAALRRSNPRFYTPEDQALEFPGDTFFQYVARLQDQQILFGVGGQSGAANIPWKGKGQRPTESGPTSEGRWNRGGSGFW